MREFGRDLRRARTILIKIGTEIVHSPEGLLAMGQIGNIVEQIAILHMRGHNIILVSSGSITIGKMVLRRQYLLSGSMQSHLGGQVEDNVEFYEKACAAAGQSGLQSLYEMLFSQYHLNCSQILASDADFREPQVRENLKKTLGTLLDVGIIPVINENDVITRRTAPLLSGEKMAWDNDSLASLFAQEMQVDLMVIITDSRVSSMGQNDKVHSCIRAVDSGAVRAAVVAKAEPGVLLRIVNGERVGALFISPDGKPIGDATTEEEHIDPLYTGIAKRSRGRLSKL
ncbi:delta-1-pyrroline-5-carboxylate synthetase, putative [Phytophthora infestans T30-4]|uniref:Delta-1-pyrroline-5-carboxylate synthetase, putative n=1 Tax=Phytophthora infestans (strain T30-4) TaxID=403677 RepID=D0N5S9_PHYIT|nr:delta-1-pyrroline-5-carboxylate synthetase, putative [Phytophthora infestans T30-4]EEY70420.1 delta-1-pyrroline-5-carboxylate synthetase, putative [Phytophthora infestans T30-4]|eukprot:XP_002998074.1 delta-1-pyrroline-5-carboxylate synthetase, putative [Phytophthora infestans T30-4]